MDLSWQASRSLTIGLFTPQCTSTLDQIGGTPGFRTMALTENDSYRLSWDERFPILYDADNDGLVSRAKGGIDPNDYNADSDGDGLSDYFENQQGYELEHADADCDGLIDYWEHFYGTDPFLADSDNDGLNDGAEFFHDNKRYPYENSALSNMNAPTCAADAKRYTGGWEIVYDFAADQPLYFGVSANANDADSDDDGISDQRELVYGYHPHVASTLNVLAIDSTIQSQTNVLPYVKPNETISYEATVSNNLRDRYARGLLQSEFPLDQVWQTQQMDAIGPLDAVTMNGTIPVNVNNSLATSMTLRAGAVIVEASEPVLELRMSEDVGTKVFADSSLPAHNFTCSSFCPTANGRNLKFDGSRIDGPSDTPIVPSQSSFTVGHGLIRQVVSPSTLWAMTSRLAL
ncbi:hypothetical protein KFU94_36875 [Chloroflexi bacterium TSY]|nr:hypothetical protein [Chloroflexi bacterium TSY]